MDIVTKATLPRQELAEFLPTPRAIKAFEAVQQDVLDQNTAISTAQFLTIEQEPSLGSERVLALETGDLVGFDGGANGPYTISLANTDVVAGGYGDAAHTLSVVVDAKGRLTDVEAFALNTSNIAEGTNLYFTTERAREAISASSGIAYDDTIGEITAVPAGTYGPPTGTVSRASYATYTAPTISAIPTQAEVQAIADALQVVSRTLAALILDLRANGNLG